MGIGHIYKKIDTDGVAPAVYHCASCGGALFSAENAFDAGCGFPSFWSHINDSVRPQELSTYGRTRTQLVCSQCGAHLGHLFPHPLTPTHVRYCISHSALVPGGDEAPKP